MPLVETRALTAEMGPTESTTTISDSGAAGSPWADPIYHLSKNRLRGFRFSRLSSGCALHH
jgi:hypothetical protein